MRSPQTRSAVGRGDNHDVAAELACGCAGPSWDVGALCARHALEQTDPHIMLAPGAYLKEKAAIAGREERWPTGGACNYTRHQGAAEPSGPSGAVRQHHWRSPCGAHGRLPRHALGARSPDTVGRTAGPTSRPHALYQSPGASGPGALFVSRALARGPWPARACAVSVGRLSVRAAR